MTKFNLTSYLFVLYLYINW